MGETGEASANEGAVRRLLRAFNERDERAILGLVDPGVEFVPLIVRAGLVSEPYRGADGIRRYLEDARGAWAEVHAEPEDVQAVGDTVVVFGEVRGRGRGGAVAVPTTWVWRLRDGRVTHGLVFSDEPAVRRALGVSPEVTAPHRASVFEVELPAARESVPQARRGLGAWLRGLRPSTDEARDVELAVSEAVANAVLHAYTDLPPGPVRLRAEPNGGELLVVVEDEGHGMRPNPDSPGLGMGLPLIGRLTESMTVLSEPETGSGCRVQMRFALAALSGRR